ncbi:hypothetical protein JTE90_028966 [Oedothorax gibbosus]|uniref:MD-2-related lipid-recognition domain-containing protein n=1 Tax=Oedothorax gibbosus TaxID=931172 RepID=A0AAV6VJA8_9ARAC|nr:hypothetical protein JTE90_028966 [Oedothorax gibbosus]
MNTLAIIFALLFNYVASEQVPFRPCKSGNTVLGVVITPCNSMVHEGFRTCVLRHEDSIRVEAAILAPFSGSKFETLATATINNHMIPFTNSGSNPCQGNINPACPVKSGRIYVLTFFFDVLKYYPTGTMDIVFAVRDSASTKSLGCVKLPVIIQRNPKLAYKN